MKRLVDILTAVQTATAEFWRRPDLQYLLIIAVVVRLLYLAFMLGQITPTEMMALTPDSLRYIGLGEELINWRIMDEAAVLIFGPGYGAFLGTVFFLFGVNALSVILVQIILSGLGCLLIYRLGRELTGSRAVGLTAGYLSAVSFTSVSLATIILSDSLFFFLFLSGNLLFWLGLKEKRRSYFVWSGIAIGLAVLTRSIGQFWPVVMLALIFLLPTGTKGKWWPTRLKRLKIAWLAPVIALVLMSIWMGRNYYHHETFLSAAAGPGGLSKVAAVAQANMAGVDQHTIRVGWVEEYETRLDKEGLSQVDHVHMYNEQVWTTLREHPGAMLQAYGELIWENVTATNELYRLQLPRYRDQILDFAYAVREYYYHTWCFWLSMLGLGLLALRRQWDAVIFLGLLYAYFAALVGFGQWQGSRLFFPAQIAGVILMAYIPYALVGFFRGIFKRGRGAYELPLRRTPF